MSKEHIAEMTSSVYHKKRGCVVRHISKFDKDNRCSHRGQGYNISLSSREKMYNAPDAYKPEDVQRKRSYKIWSGGKRITYRPKSHPKNRIADDLWNIGVRGNFTKRWTHPYLHNYHHMIPNGVLNQELYDEEEYGNRLLKLLMAGEYNINHGRNIILLPKEMWVGKTIKLPVHCPGRARSHGQYSGFVRPKLESIKEKLKKLLEDKKIHEVNPDNVGKVAEQVHKISDGLLKILKSLEPGSNLNRREALETAAS